MDNVQLAKRLVRLAKVLAAENGEDEVDEQFAAKVRALKTQMSKLGQKKRRRLKQYGIGVIRPNATVEELVDALSKVLAEA